MLEIKIAPRDFFDEDTGRFVTVEETVLHLEHSLAAVSKWEQIHHLPLLAAGTELVGPRLSDYLKCMVTTENADLNLLDYAEPAELDRIQAYIGSVSSATTFRPSVDRPGGGPQDVITSELIYFWMNHFRIPVEPAEHWHLNRLFNLIRIHSEKSKKPKKRNPQEIAAERRIENERRRKMAEANA